MFWYLVFLAVVALARLLELLVSKKNWKRHQTKASLLKEPLFFWMVLLHTSVFVLLPLELFLRRPQFGGWLSFVAIGITAMTFGPWPPSVAVGMCAWSTPMIIPLCITGLTALFATPIIWWLSWNWHLSH